MDEEERVKFLEMFAGLSEEGQAAMRKLIEQFHLKLDDLAIVLLKGHLMIEEVLTDILSASVRAPEYLRPANLRFYQKLCFARSVSLARGDHRMWDLMISLNALRNDLAHSLSTEARAPRLARVRELYLEEFRDAEAHRTLNDKDLLTAAVAGCLGFLGAFLEEAKFLRSATADMDDVMRELKDKPS
jgi:hypothetical protein